MSGEKKTVSKEKDTYVKKKKRHELPERGLHAVGG